MKIQLVAALVALLVLSLSFGIAQTKENAKADCPMTKTCCATGSKASMSTHGAHDANVILASDKKSSAKTTTNAKECPMMGTKASKSECTDAEKAHCDMNKASTTKTSNSKDCCKDKAKSTKAEKKTAPEKTEAKGTN